MIKTDLQVVSEQLNSMKTEWNNLRNNLTFNRLRRYAVEPVVNDLKNKVEKTLRSNTISIHRNDVRSDDNSKKLRELKSNWTDLLNQQEILKAKIHERLDHVTNKTTDFSIAQIEENENLFDA